MLCAHVRDRRASGGDTTPKSAQPWAMPRHPPTELLDDYAAQFGPAVGKLEA